MGADNEEKKVLLHVEDLHVKFRVRGRTLTALRGISLDIYENESIAIVGESGCGKSVFTQTFAGMLDSNGYVDSGHIIFNDPELADVHVPVDSSAQSKIAKAEEALNKASKLEFGAETYRQMKELEREREERMTMSEEDEAEFERQKNDLTFRRAEAYNKRQTFDSKTEKDKIKEMSDEVSRLDKEIKDLDKKKEQKIKNDKAAAKADTSYEEQYKARMDELKNQYDKECSREISEETKQRNAVLAKEIWMSVAEYSYRRRNKSYNGLLKAMEEAMRVGKDLDNEEELNDIFSAVSFRVKYLDETATQMHGNRILDLAKINYNKDWTKIRGSRIAFIFQDPMTSLNPIITIGKQLVEVIQLHQHLNDADAKREAISMMQKVGITDAENRFDDYPFQYSGGMRQRIVIAIALCCQPKILVCDEPTTALDVTIQAQILKLIKDLQKEFGYTIVFITHDMGVVANIAERVAVLYAGQIIEVGTVDDIFYDPHHPYTWALLSSLPQLADKDTELFSIGGTPPSLYNNIVGDPFAPRNAYSMKIDSLKEPPMFKVSDTHYAKTWLLDPRAEKVEKPEIIHDISGRLIDFFNIK